MQITRLWILQIEVTMISHWKRDNYHKVKDKTNSFRKKNSVKQKNLFFKSNNRKRAKNRKTHNFKEIYVSFQFSRVSKAIVHEQK